MSQNIILTFNSDKQIFRFAVMEDIIGYVILFVVGMSVLYAYQWKKSKKRHLPLSIQNYADANLQFSIQKQNGKTQEYLLQIIAKSNIDLNSVTIELINNQRKIEVINIQSIAIEKNKVNLVNGGEHSFHFAPEFLKALLSQTERKFSSFRFVVENEKGKKYKTHELAMNKKWSIYKPDSGTYN